MVKEALEEAEKAQIAAEKAIKQADEDIQGTQNLLTSVSYQSLYVGESTRMYSFLSERGIWYLVKDFLCP